MSHAIARLGRWRVVCIVPPSASLSFLPFRLCALTQEKSGGWKPENHKSFRLVPSRKHRDSTTLTRELHSHWHRSSSIRPLSWYTNPSLIRTVCLYTPCDKHCTPQPRNLSQVRDPSAWSLSCLLCARTALVGSSWAPWLRTSLRGPSFHQGLSQNAYMFSPSGKYIRRKFEPTACVYMRV